MKVKIFCLSAESDEEVKDNQKYINKWLAKHSNIKILEFQSNYIDEEYSLTILYKESEGLDQFTEES